MLTCSQNGKRLPSGEVLDWNQFPEGLRHRCFEGRLLRLSTREMSEERKVALAVLSRTVQESSTFGCEGYLWGGSFGNIKGSKQE